MESTLRNSTNSIIVSHNFAMLEGAMHMVVGKRDAASKWRRHSNNKNNNSKILAAIEE